MSVTAFPKRVVQGVGDRPVGWRFIRSRAPQTDADLYPVPGRIAWGALGVAFACVWMWSRVDGLELVTSSATLFLVLGLLLAIAGYCRLRTPKIAPICHGYAYFMATLLILAIAQYPASVTKLQLIDSTLLSIDSALGIDWKIMYLHVHSAPWLWTFLNLVYPVAIPEVAVVCFVLGLVDPSRLRIFLVANAICLGICCLLFALYPAVDPLKTLGLPMSAFLSGGDQLFEGLRQGSVRTIDVAHMTGMITFPSYHGALATLVVLACLRLRRWIAVLAIAFQLLIIISTPVIGGHYVTDVIAGIVLAVVSMAVASRFYNASPSRHIWFRVQSRSS